MADLPLETTQGPWRRAVLTEDAQAWSHWVRRPCRKCKHAFADHENEILPAPGSTPCIHCDCVNFKEPDLLRSEGEV